MRISLPVSRNLRRFHSLIPGSELNILILTESARIVIVYCSFEQGVALPELDADFSSAIPGKPYESSPLQITYYFPGITGNSAFLSRRKYQATTWFFVNSACVAEPCEGQQIKDQHQYVWSHSPLRAIFAARVRYPLS